MQHSRNTEMNARQQRPAGAYPVRPERWRSGVARPESQSPQDAQRNYERYLALAQAKTQSGDTVEAENYYQHAEHCFRMMATDRGTT